MALTRPKASQINTVITNVSDPLIVLNNGSTAANIDVGLVLNRDGGTSPNVALFWDESANNFVTSFTSSSGKTDANVEISGYANIRAGYFIGDGSLLTNVGGYGNVQVAEYLLAHTGNISAGNVIAGTVYGNIGGGSALSNIYVTGSLIPSANITYDLGSPSQRWRDGWFSGTTIHIGTESMSVDENGKWVFTSGGSAVEIGANVEFSLSSANISGNITASNFNFANGVSMMSVMSLSMSEANTAMKGYVDEANTIQSNQIAGANAAITAANTAMKGYVDEANTIQSNQIAGANSAITAANTAMKGYVDEANTIQSNQIAGANSAIISANTAMKGYVDLAVTTANTNLKGYVDGQITNLVNGAPATLDTLNELAEALGNDANLSVTITNQIANANTNMKGYVDNQVITANTAMKSYVDQNIQGLNAKPSVKAATTGNLIATYDNGNLGVGGTLTSTTNGTFPQIDGVTVNTLFDGVLVKDQTFAQHNGRYFLSNIGAAEYPWVLTRCGLCDEAKEIPGAYIFVQAGTVNKGTGWVQTVNDPSTFTVGTDPITVTLFTGAASYTAGTGLTLNVTQFSVNNNQPQITSIGTLDSLSVAGNVSVLGNLLISGNLITTDVDNLQVDDSLIYFAKNNTTDFLDIGFVGAFTKNSVYQHGGLVRDATDGIWKFFNNVNPTPTTTIDFGSAEYSPIQAGNIFAVGNVVVGANLRLSGALLNAGGSGGASGQYLVSTGNGFSWVDPEVSTLTDSDDTTVTADGDYVNVVVNSSNILTISEDVVSVGGNISATYFLGNGSQLVGLPAGYADSDVADYLPTYTGNIGASDVNATNLYGTILTAAQTSITSVGTLSTLVVTGNITSSGKFIGDGSLLTGLPAGYTNTDVANYLPTHSGNVGASSVNATNLYGTIRTAAQTSITSVGTLTGLNVSGTLNAGYNTVGQVQMGGDSNGSIEIGQGGRGSSGVPFIDFHSSVNSPDFDVRIQASGGSSAASGTGALTFTATGGVLPGSDNSTNLGASGTRWATVYGVTFSGVATTAKYADLAENYSSDKKYVSGTVVIFGGAAEVTISTQSHDPSVAGVVSTNPAYLMNDTVDGVAVALQGRVPCRVLGPVSKGDRVVSSDVRGVAERLDLTKYQPGCIIGKALEAVPDNEIATIEVVVGRN